VSHSSPEILKTPRRDELGLTRIVNSAGVSISLLPSGAIFAIEHTEGSRRIMINQSLASPIASGMGRLYLRLGGTAPTIVPVIGSEAGLRVGASDDRFVWEGEHSGCMRAQTYGYGGSMSSTAAIANCHATPSSSRISASANKAF
jgi:hypothetical protein